MYRIAVCEDEETLRDNLCGLCRELLEELGEQGQVRGFPSAERLEEAWKEGAVFDLLCLDILMEGKTGMELAQTLRAQDDQVSILFITSSEEHLRQGYSVRPIQYLFKPVKRQELKEAIQTDLRLRRPKTLVLHAAGQVVTLAVEKVWYVESHNHTVWVWTGKGSESYRMSLSQVEKLLPPGQFCRCHNSYLVNMEHISSIGRKEVLLDNGLRVPVSRGCYSQAMDQFVRYLNR